MSRRSHYDALGLQPSATRDEIREAFERLSSILDADSLALYALVGAGEQEAEIDRVREAHRVLADPAARTRYDEEVGFAPDEIELGDADIVSSTPLVAAGGTPVAEEPPARVVDDPEPEEPVADEPPAKVVDDPEPDEPVADEPPARVADDPEREEPVADEPPARVVSDPDPQVAEAHVSVASGPPLDEPPMESAGTPSDRSREEPPPAPAILEVDENTEFTGELLRTLREARGLTLKDVAARTRIGTNYLQAIEDETFDRLPARVFLRGFLVSFARELKLDAARVADTYLRRLG